MKADQDELERRSHVPAPRQISLNTRFRKKPHDRKKRQRTLPAFVWRLRAASLYRRSERSFVSVRDTPKAPHAHPEKSESPFRPTVWRQRGSPQGTSTPIRG